MATEFACLVETLVAKPEAVDIFKQRAITALRHLRSTAGVEFVELLQSDENPAAFWLVVKAPRAQWAELGRQWGEAEWHQELVRALPDLLAEPIKKVLGVALDAE